MTSATVETLSRVDDFDASAATMGLETSDWFLPGIESTNCDTVGDSLPRPAQSRIETTAQETPPRVSAPVRKSNLSIRLSDQRVRLLQQWECVVHQVHSDYVSCEMHDLTDASKPVEYAEIYTDEFHEFDRPLLQEGVVFYWSIGHEVSKVGQVRRYSELRVRRMPGVSKLRKGEIARKAKQLSELLLTSND